MKPYEGKRTDQLTDEERELVRRDWEEAEKRVRGKPTRLAFPRISSRPAVPNKFDREDCEGCKQFVARGHPVPTKVEDKWLFLCRACRAKVEDAA